MQNLYRLSPLFSDKLFYIPDYQRGYAWKTEQCEDLLEDLELLAPAKQHFMGTLVLHPRTDQVSDFINNEGHTFKAYDIIDGQQRITTLVLYLYAIYQEMQSLAELNGLSNGLERTFIIVRDMNEQAHSKLTLNRDSHQYFFKVVMNQAADNPPPKIRSHRLLRDAKEFFRQHLAAKRTELGAGFPAWLKQRYLQITQQLEFIAYEVDTDTDAGIIFETMNNRGKQITELEKVKNYLLYLASKLNLPADHDLAQEINATWTNLFESLMAAGVGSSDDENRILRAHWLMAYDYDRRHWEGSKSIKNQFSLRNYQDGHQKLLTDVKAYLSSLNNAITAYCDIYNPRHPQAFGTLAVGDSLREKLLVAADRLHRVGSLATFLPLLLATHAQAFQNGQAYLQMVELCERFSFRVYSWRGKRSNAGESWLFYTGYQLFGGAKNFESALNEVRRAVLYYCSEAEFEGRFRRENVNWYAWGGIKYFLYEYENHLARQSGDTVKMPWDELVKAEKRNTIEHILPQNISGVRYWEERFSPELHSRYAHDIGNLTLTLDNPSLSNDPFPQKKGTASQEKCYASSKLFIEQQLARYDEWTPNAIEKRRQTIELWAKDRWQVGELISADDVLDVDEVSPEDFHLLLNRISVPWGQKQLYSALYHRPDGLTADELVEVMPRKDRQDLSGVLGALGNRINRTPGYCQKHTPGIALVFDINWKGDQYHYCLRSAIREVLDEMAPEWLDLCAPQSVNEGE